MSAADKIFRNTFQIPEIVHMADAILGDEILNTEMGYGEGEYRLEDTPNIVRADWSSVS